VIICRHASSRLQTILETSISRENYLSLCLEGLVQLNISSTSSLVYPKSLVLIKKNCCHFQSRTLIIEIVVVVFVKKSSKLREEREEERERLY
jgi:hypothetical protein